MKNQIELGNGNTYDLVIGGVLQLEPEKLQLTIRPGAKSFDQINLDFENESNTSNLRILNQNGDAVESKRGFTHLDSVTKQNDYVLGSEEYTDEDGNLLYKPKTGVVYIIVLSKPSLTDQLKNLQETVDLLVLDRLEE